jgi:hypothetical protein
MAHLHNFHNNKNPSMFESIGHKIKSIAEVAGAVKTIYDIGKGIHSVVGPVASAAALALA